MNMNEIITTERAQKNVANAMDEITRTTRKVLMDYVLGMYHTSLAKAIAFLGIDSSEGKELLDNMDEKTRKIIESAAYGLQKSDETVTSEVEHILNSSGINFAKEYKELKENLLYANYHSAKEFLWHFYIECPIFRNELNKCIFCFEDLKDLDDRSIQLLLRETELSELTKALKGTSNELQEKFFINMTERKASMLKEDMEWIGPVRKSDVNDAQYRILKTIYKLAGEGSIVIERNDRSDLVN